MECGVTYFVIDSLRLSALVVYSDWRASSEGSTLSKDVSVERTEKKVWYRLVIKIVLGHELAQFKRRVYVLVNGIPIGLLAFEG